MEATNVRRRQVVDIPPLQLEVTEHHAESKEYCGCGHIAEFSEDVKTSVQYGARIKSLLVTRRHSGAG